MATSKKNTDWESIEKAYRAGSLSVRAIAEKHDVSHVTIHKRANKNGWQRDLTERVRSEVRRKVNTPVNTKGEQLESVNEANIIDEASDAGASIVLAHRNDLAQWRGISTKLLNALSDMDVDESNHNDFARSLNAGVDAQLKVIKGERQAYNLDDVQGDKDTSALSDLMDTLSQEA